MEHTTWVEVSRTALERNLAAASAHAGVPVCAVIKANAYGHGLIEAARTFAGAGAAMLAVTRIEEARALRAAGIDAPLLIMMPVPDPAEAVSLGAEIVAASASDAQTVPPGARVHLKVDTGMGRLGIAPAEAVQAAAAIGGRATLAGVMTHFADAAGRSGPEQLGRFLNVVATLRAAGFDAPAHAANSAALLAMPQSRLDMVRPGTLLYGQDPPGAKAPWRHEETFAWFARVASVRTLKEGATVGYGSEWRAKRAVRVATIPVGYADGFAMEPASRSPSAVTAARAAATTLRASKHVLFGHRRAPVIGRVAMQAITVSLDGLDDVEPGSVARIPARRLAVNTAIERVYA